MHGCMAADDSADEVSTRFGRCIMAAPLLVLADWPLHSHSLVSLTWSFTLQGTC